MRRFRVILLMVLGGFPVIADAAEPDGAVEHFERKVRPLLAERCWKCHGPDQQDGELRLDTASGLRRGSESGPVVVKGKPDASRIIEVVRRTGEIRMPPQTPLQESEITDLVKWIRDGAVWPNAAPTRSATESSDGSLFSTRDKSYWAFQPVRDPRPPVVRGTRWVQSDVDRFVLARLEAQNLSPAPSAHKRTLLRRVTFDLIGLPPTPEELDAFLADESPDAFAKVVERLLKSRHYGERWARRWLGLVRYGDTADINGIFLSLYAWRYRDYVVNALNSDKPYDEFIVEQLAGDLLEPTDDALENAERVIATGFLMLGPKTITEIDKERMVMQIVEEQIDVTGRALLGLTVACARCHDHKFDPIPTEDYYSLAGIFYSTQSMADLKQVDSKWMERPLSVPGEKEPIMVLAVQDGEPKNLRVNIRGSHRRLGEEVPRRFLQIIAGENHPPIETGQSGRLELAHWIASAEHPLTARVMVNRIWQGHFGTGLVPTSDNFGASGQRPSHPDLLDWLASRFVESGWSIKAMHRLMLNSSTYQQSSSVQSRIQSPAFASGDPQTVDPDNRLLWRMSPRRLEAEEIRDAVLVANRQLDLTMGGTLLGEYTRYVDGFVDIKRGLIVTLLTGRTFHPYYSTRRSIYLPMMRQRLPEVFQLFDVGNASAVTAKRSETTVAPQALYLMNSPFIREQSFHFARHLLGLPNTTDADRVRIAYLELLGRPATQGETESAIDYVSRLENVLAADARPSQATIFPEGLALTFTAERAPHRHGIYDEIKPILEKPSGVRLRFSVTDSAWPPENRDTAVDWKVLSPIRATASSGAAPRIGPEQTVIVQGSEPAANTYEIVAHTHLNRITAIRLEVLPDPAEPPERSIPDLFVLSEFQTRASPLTNASEDALETSELCLQHAALRLPEGDITISPAIDADRTTYWHIGPRRKQPGVVIFETEDPHTAAWQSYCRALLCLNEFVYVE